ncbi:OPT oligopeptide transporter protein [bacterium BMS3Abin03]|nr:OPT oligopeptide transporter protein [bacterium BMS3Abin03]
MAENNSTESTIQPYVPADKKMKELTFKSLSLGILLAMILGSANVYLGLKAGMTVAATFPAAVIAMAVLRIFKGNVLEENIARTTASVGEALAAGAIFTIPAFVISGVWDEFNYWESTVLMLVGGVLGVLLITILRRTLVGDKSLPFPESQACTEIVKAGQGGNTGAKYVFATLGLGSLIEVFKNANGITLIKDTVKGFWQFGISKISLVNSKAEVVSEIKQKGGFLAISPTASPAFLGVGYIIGFRLSAITFSGGVFGWVFLMPIVLFLMYNDLSGVVAQNGGDWLSVAGLAYNATVKPIAVGGMLVGAFYTLFSMRKSLIEGVWKGFKDIKAAKGQEGKEELRTEKDLPFKMVLISVGVIILVMIGVYSIFIHTFEAALLAGIVMAVAAFVFAAVAGYLVGIIGSSSNPISGLTLSTLLIAAVLMVLVGMKGNPGIIAALAVASVVCVVAGVSGDMMQDLKIGQLLGGTPWKMELGEMIGVVFASMILIFPIILLNEANGIGSDALPAPQAGLMAMVAKGIVGGEMAWPLVIAGMFFAVALILIKSPSPMLIAVGMYLPFQTTFAIFIGGIIKYAVDKIAENKNATKEETEVVNNTGLLLASGLVAGEALVGIVLAGFVGAGISLKHVFGIPEAFEGYWVLGLVVFAILAYVLIKYPLKELMMSRSKSKQDN